MNSKNEVQTVNHKCVYISLFQWTDINLVISIDLNPDKHNTQAVHIHLFTWLKYVSAVPPSHHDVENTSA
jgi:hypothetical protein